MKVHHRWIKRAAPENRNCIPGYTLKTHFHLAAFGRFLLVCIPVLLAAFFLPTSRHNLHGNEGAKTTGRIQGDQLTASLPWSFNETREDMTGQPFPHGKGSVLPARLSRLQLVSKEPVARTGSKSTYLRITLTRGKFSSPEEAAGEFRTIKKAANPDFGLSYKWDTVLLSGPIVFHLQAECTLAEQHFTTLADRLVELTGDQEGQEKIFCRCGGGCI